ncbi:MAG: hypothetical protein KVP17_001677 [Porospora cf. gigantea B]|uniref:uncharacterized protein n=1 Tax=Porospora cf. gigantea B TaxID=2853592 RepID=UPI0035719D8A|nr:MAG: hypothetical protein KVP17_001677 [Porospora cf. gigantea B]
MRDIDSFSTEESSGGAGCSLQLQLDEPVCLFLEKFGLRQITKLGRVLQSAVTMMLACDYTQKDVLIALAGASVNFGQALACVCVSSGTDEWLYLAILELYLSHCWFFDHACPLSIWHRELFYSYCSLVELNSAVVQLMAIHDFRVRPCPERVIHEAERLSRNSYTNNKLLCLVFDPSRKFRSRNCRR